jgi:hypothetical protein
MEGLKYKEDKEDEGGRNGGAATIEANTMETRSEEESSDSLSALFDSSIVAISKWPII